MNDKITWHGETRKISDLNPAVYNPRQLTEKQAKDIANSLDEFGLADPIVINLNNTIIGGHQRINILRAQGATEVDVRVPDRLLTESEERRLNLRLNKNTGMWDLDALANFDDEELMAVGFEPAELDNIFDLETGLTKPDDVPAVPSVAISKQGDIYQLGEHRLMCGDSTDIVAVKRLVSDSEGTESAMQMVFTDPPYNVNYKGQGENTSEGIENDHIDPDMFQDFIGHAFENLFQVMAEGAVYYICSGWSSYPVFNQKLIDIGFQRAGVIIWKKDNAAYGWNDYRYKHEWIVVGKRKENRLKAVSMLYGWKKAVGGGGHFFRSTRDEYDVWEVPRKSSSNYVHPTEKPVWLIEKALANSSERGWNILDLFGGSGSTLIACERLKRKAFVMEFDPKYVDVIVARWEQYTGLKAEKISELEPAHV